MEVEVGGGWVSDLGFEEGFVWGLKEVNGEGF